MEKNFQKQTKLYDAVKGTRGNCMMACYASFLGLNINDVPAIEELFSCTKPNGFWFDTIQLWWRLMGYDFYMTDKEADIPEEVKQGLYFASGLSERGVYHMVIYQNGIMVFDPHPSNAGIIKPERNFEWVIRKGQP